MRWGRRVECGESYAADVVETLRVDDCNRIVTEKIGLVVRRAGSSWLSWRWAPTHKHTHTHKQTHPNNNFDNITQMSASNIIQIDILLVSKCTLINDKYKYEGFIVSFTLLFKTFADWLNDPPINYLTNKYSRNKISYLICLQIWLECLLVQNTENPLV